MCGICIWVQVYAHARGRQGRMASLAASKLWQSRHHCQPVLRLQMCLDAFNFWQGLGEPDTGPHACIARTHTSPQSPAVSPVPRLLILIEKSMLDRVVVPVFTVLGSLRQKDGRFHASLDYMRVCLKRKKSHVFKKWKMFFPLCMYSVLLKQALRVFNWIV